jgi:hypothetical protein
MISRSLYFVNWWFDAALMGGLSIATYLVFAAFYTSADPGRVATIAYILSLLVSLPHFSATVYRLYQCSDHTRQFPVTAWALPPILLAAVLACFWQPDRVAPYFVLLTFLWSAYHYSGQTIGLTMVYARRAGFPIGRRERLALSAFVFSAFLCGFLALEQQRVPEFYGLTVPIVAVPLWMRPAAQALMSTGALAFVALTIKWAIKHRRLPPAIVFLPPIAHFVWAVPGIDIRPFFLLTPLFHSLQYLLVALVVQLKLKIDADGGERSWRRIRGEALRWGARNITGGILLFFGIPVLLSWLPLPSLTIVGIVASALNIHHFFVDGVIWKLRDASSSSGLLINVADLSQAPVQELASDSVAAGQA